eukprot:s43_g47.t1
MSRADVVVAPETSPVAPEVLGAGQGRGGGPNGSETEQLSEIASDAEAAVETATSSSSSFHWEEVRRQELRDQGFSPAEIDAIFVRQHRQEVMAEASAIAAAMAGQWGKWLGEIGKK